MKFNNCIRNNDIRVIQQYKINRRSMLLGDFQLNTANDLQNLAGFSSPSVLSGQWPNQLSAAAAQAALQQQQYVSQQ